MASTSRRQFLSDLGSGALLTTVGVGVAGSLGVVSSRLLDGDERLDLGRHGALVRRMQETEADALIPQLVGLLREGSSLQDVVAAAALANAETTGGTDYEGYHAFMALVPAWEMARLLPTAEAALPVLKVVHRSCARLRKIGGVRMKALESGASEADRLRALQREGDMVGAERRFLGVVDRSREEAFEALQPVVRDTLDVHQVVLSWRAWDVMRLTGVEQAAPLLRSALRQCVDREQSRVRRGKAEPAIRRVLPRLIEEHGLERAPGRAEAMPEERFDELVRLVYGGSPEDAAAAVAEALAEGLDPEEIGEVLSVASTQLLLRDPGRRSDEPGKPRGSVHGASVGVHACDSANAWRRIARLGSWRNRAASLVAGAYHTAGRSAGQDEHARPHEDALHDLGDRLGARLVEVLGDAVRQGAQDRACAAAARALATGCPVDALAGELLRHSLLADGALHAEKYFFTAIQEFAEVRPRHREANLVALARVCASQSAFADRGYQLARKALNG